MEIKKITLPRKIVGYKTTESWSAVPHVTFIYEADATEMLDELNALNENSPDFKATINTLLLKICTEAVKAAPQVNARIKYSRLKASGVIEYMENIDISMPMALENGEIITINLRNSGKKTLRQIQEYTDETARKIKNCDICVPMYRVSVKNMTDELKKGRFLKAACALLGAEIDKSRPRREEIKEYDKISCNEKITPQDLEPGTITISNIGSVCKGINGFIGILEVIPPQVFVIGIGSVQEKACAVKNENNEKSVAIRKIIPMCLAFDHRALNFGEIVPFIQKLDYTFSHGELLRDWYFK